MEQRGRGPGAFLEHEHVLEHGGLTQCGVRVEGPPPRARNGHRPGGGTHPGATSAHTHPRAIHVEKRGVAGQVGPQHQCVGEEPDEAPPSRPAGRLAIAVPTAMVVLAGIPARSNDWNAGASTVMNMVAPGRPGSPPPQRPLVSAAGISDVDLSPPRPVRACGRPRDRPEDLERGRGGRRSCRSQLLELDHRGTRPFQLLRRLPYRDVGILERKRIEEERLGPGGELASYKRHRALVAGNRLRPRGRSTNVMHRPGPATWSSGARRRSSPRIHRSEVRGSNVRRAPSEPGRRSRVRPRSRGRLPTVRRTATGERLAVAPTRLDRFPRRRTGNVVRSESCRTEQLGRAPRWSASSLQRAPAAAGADGDVCRSHGAGSRLNRCSPESLFARNDRGGRSPRLRRRGDSGLPTRFSIGGPVRARRGGIPRPRNGADVSFRQLAPAERRFQGAPDPMRSSRAENASSPCRRRRQGRAEAVVRGPA